eukprot:TRINITY_DN3761_c0_g1_i3.p1 TRINITY_DN3761_c0_g1~~TRINITY_DN3761_c0_g1_i3.p1  ORF type:complete len:936 (-),score=261.83 TRINITY_DN3761_c0_g1_i3:308-3115(-)
MIRRPPRSTLSSSSAASDVYKRQYQRRVRGADCDRHAECNCRSLSPSSDPMQSEPHLATKLLEDDAEEPLTPTSRAHSQDGAWSVFRSEEMSPVRICLPIDEAVATSTIRAVAATSMVQVNDRNADMPESARRFKDQLKLCHDCLRYVRKLEDEVIRADEESAVQLFERTIDQHSVYNDLNKAHEILSSMVADIDQSNFATVSIIKNRNEAVEHAAVLLHAGEFVNFAIEQSPRSLGVPEDSSSLQTGLLDMESGTTGQDAAMVRCVTGVCITRTAESFSRALFRGLRGCVLMQMHHLDQEITDPVTGQPIFKSAFAAVCTGEASVDKIRHIAVAFSAHMYECPTAQLDRERELARCVEEIAAIDTVLNTSKVQKLEVLRSFYQQCIALKHFCLQERLVYHTLNCFELSPENTLLVADCWIPSAARQQVVLALEEGSGAATHRAFLETWPIPDNARYPTFIRTNKFTDQFQAIVDTYGVPSYREANPAFFAVAMFPFLFGVMFGDIVHGSLMLIFSLLLIGYEDKIKPNDIGEIGAYLYNGRYMILVMSLCAIYMGFIYNEALSLSLDLFGGSRFGSDFKDPNFGHSTPYPMGVDPAWRHSANNIQFTNSLKMKMSVILGVSQMTVGILLKLINNVFFKKWLEVIVESIPEIIFMTFTFGYMCVLIFRKWSIQYLPFPPDCFGSGCVVSVDETGSLITQKAAPPMIITTMIKMFNLENVPPEDVMYAGQNSFQRFLVIAAVLVLPILLLGKPLYLKRKADQAQAQYSSVMSKEDNAAVEMDGYGVMPDPLPEEVGEVQEHDKFEFGEVFTHQAIHTIEFALGCVSNTASYLRLWALSLAHSQLSEVFYEYILSGYNLYLFGYYPGIAGGTAVLVCSYFAFFMATVGILMGMESLSAFLHALRLQWVEFQSKFYDAQGVAFAPLTLEGLDAGFRED